MSPLSNLLGSEILELGNRSTCKKGACTLTKRDYNYVHELLMSPETHSGDIILFEKSILGIQS